MTKVAQFVHRHRCVDALGPRERIAKYYFICVCDALPAPKQQSVAWCSLFTLSVGKRTRRCMACLAQIAHRHGRLGALVPKA